MDMQIQFELGQHELRKSRRVFGTPNQGGWLALIALLTGFFVGAPLLIRAESWLLLSFSGIAYLALTFLAWYRVAHAKKKLSPIATTVVLADFGISTKTNASESSTAWTAYSEFIETGDYFYLRAFESVSTLPKRAMTQDQIVLIRETLESKINSDSSDSPAINLMPAIDLIERYLPANEHQVFGFNWSQVELKQLPQTRLYPLSQSPTRPSSPWLRRAILALGLFGGGWLLFNAIVQLVWRPHDDWQRTRSAMIMLGAALGPVFAVVAILIQRFRVKRAFKRARLPTETVRVCLTNDAMVMGISGSAGKYALADIMAFYRGNGFIGFQLYDGLVHTLPSKAFGTDENAHEFVLHADRQRLSIQKKGSGEKRPPIESDNPYQSPNNV